MQYVSIEAKCRTLLVPAVQLQSTIDQIEIPSPSIPCGIQKSTPDMNLVFLWRLNFAIIGYDFSSFTKTIG